jgi:hypothetical protein
LRGYPHDLKGWIALFAVMVTRRLQTTDNSATMSYFSTLVYLVIAFVLAPLVMAVGPIPNAQPSIAFLFRAWSIPNPVGFAGHVWAGAGLGRRHVFFGAGL